MPAATIIDLDALPAVLNMRHVQLLLGISRVKAYELASSRGFPAMRIGRAIRVSRQALVRWMDEHAGIEVGQS